MTMTKFCVAVSLMALSGAACSSEPETEYPQPAASMGEEATPAEATPPPNATQGQEGTPAAQPASSTTAAPIAPVAAMPTAATPETGPAPGAAQLTDAEIAKVTDAVNTGEIEQAQLAKVKATNQRVKNFATMMINQHTQLKQKDAQLARKLTLTPEDNSVAQELTNKGARMLADLKMVDATAFDKMYMESQVKQHREVLQMLDAQLIPQARESELKASLEKARAMVQMHLTEAQQIQQQLQ